MTKYQWLLAIHVLGAFLFVSGSILAGLLHFAAMRRERPSEIAVALRLVRVAVVIVGIGSVVSLGLGIWLVDYLPGYDFDDAWILAALVLWAVSVALSGPGGTRARHARELAERLAAAGDAPSEDLKRAVADRAALALNYASFAVLLAILGLMIWKPA